MRGKGRKPQLHRECGGITPACAGKSFPSLAAVPVLQDHPRMCGEKCKRNRETGSRRGSPPHVRGKEGTAADIKVSGRITPACAGKRQSNCGQRTYRRDHPRMCGEKDGRQELMTAVKGSPPHVRGKADQDPQRRQAHGITPACAGKRLRLSGICLLHGDHPRMCGEKYKFQVQLVLFVGSPPHVRGKADVNLFHVVPPRITPACAGKRVLLSEIRRFHRDHPRMCGEKHSCDSVGTFE